MLYSQHFNFHWKLLVLVSRIQKCGTGGNNFDKCPNDQNDQTGQSGQPSKLVPNIPVGPNRNGPFHLIYQPRFSKFWGEWKVPHVCVPSQNRYL